MLRHEIITSFAQNVDAEKIEKEMELQLLREECEQKIKDEIKLNDFDK